MSAPFTRPVPQILGGAALAAPDTTRAVAALYFPSAGGVQAIDVTGAVFNIASSSGSIIPVADNADDLGSAALRWRKLFIGTSIDAPSINAGGSGNVNLSLSGTGTGVIATTSPLTVTPTAVATGVQNAFVLTGAANMGVTAAAEAIDVNFNLARTVTWAAGAGPLALQRGVSIAAPTYAGNADGALTITNAATFYISGAPVQGANMMLTNTFALVVASGISRFGGAVTMASSATVSTTLDIGGALTLSGASPTFTATSLNQGITIASNGSGATALRGGVAANIVAVDNAGGGNAARLGFFNVGPVVRQTCTDLATVISALQAYGLST